MNRTFSIAMLKWLFAALALLLSTLASPWGFSPQVALAQPYIAPPQEGEIVDEIRVAGNRRANTDEILYNILQEEGAPLDLQVISDDIKRIFRMGFFDDIQVDSDQVDGAHVLTYYVLEKPAIAAITYVGNDAFSEEDLAEQVSLQVPSILDHAKVKANEEKLRVHYVKEGYYLAEVQSDVIDRPDGDVEVLYTIREFPKVTIKEITILGNEAISDQEIKDHIFSREANIFSFISSAGEFKEEEFKRDLQRIAAYYADSGYPDARVSDPQVKLSADRRSIYITLTVDEGEPYTIGEISVSGDLIQDDQELLDLLELQSGEPFRISTLFADVKRLRSVYADDGYAYANVEPKRHKNTEDLTLDLTYDISKGKRVRIGEITIVGNAKTADKVIRREVLVNEGEIYNGTKVERTQQRVTRLGFFEKVDVTTHPAKDRDYIDVQIEVSERPTGTFQVGAGFSSVESFIATIQVSQQNFLGRGQSLTANATFSGIRQLFNLQWFDPYFFDTDWRFRATLFNFEYLFSDFTRSSTGGTLGLGYPLTEDREWVLDLTYTLENVDVTPGGRLGKQQRNVGSLFKGGFTSSVAATLAWDTRDNRLFPTSGWIQQLTLEVADEALLSENEFTRIKGRSRWYFPLFWDFVLKFNIEAGLVSNWNAGGDPVPIFERFFVGGPNSVRGFRRSSLGPARNVAANIDDPASTLTEFNIGGNKQLLFNAEIEFPILTSVGIKGVFFADAGNAFDNNQPLSVNLDLFADEAEFTEVLRTAVGVGFRWLSPIGPLRFEWGFPVEPLPDEESMVFEFSIGNSF